MQYNRMTEKDFYLLCHGYEQKDLKSAKELRMLMYTIVCGYADPKKLPPIHRWMPLDGDEVKTIDVDRVKQIVEAFKNIKGWQVNRMAN